MPHKKKRKALLITLLVIFLIGLATIITLVCVDLFSNPITVFYELNEDNTYSASIGYDNRTSSKIKSVKNIKISSSHDGKPVTNIKNAGLNTCNIPINEIIVPDSVTSIEDEAFSDFLELKKLTLPSSIQEIGAHIASASIELNFQSNDYFTFENNCIVEKATKTAIFGLNGCTIPDDTEIIGNRSFVGATLANSALPTSITKICEGGFFSATFDFDKLVITENIREIESQAFSYVKGINNTLQISSTGVINSMAFSYCSIQTLIYDVEPNVIDGYKVLEFDSKINAYYENENMPVLSNKKEIESDMPGYRKYRT
ncbi:MAG: leucine-rich repeat domain-containing protein [Clostridia bacterium]|nr:leucine-rich repeat domain-containing protein [Clostridia bacterium]